MNSQSNLSHIGYIYQPTFKPCITYLLDNYLLQALGWALTEYGDSLQSLVNTPSLNTNSFNVHSSVSDIVTKEVSITLHYITLLKCPTVPASDIQLLLYSCSSQGNRD